MSDLTILGDGAFGSFLKEILAPHFELNTHSDSILLAIPASAYGEVARGLTDKHLINVCSIQSSTTKTLLQYSHRVTSIHPLFGRRTPADKRSSIMTHSACLLDDVWFQDKAENDFLAGFSKVSTILKKDWSGDLFTPESHDRLMGKTHLTALLVAQQAQVWVNRVKDVPDEYLPNSFRLLRSFVKTMEDMPPGTVSSILANEH